jgi:hypothetical protein
MRAGLSRAVLTVTRHADGCAVEHEREHFGYSVDKEDARASAHKRARQLSDAGEHGFYRA